MAISKVQKATYNDEIKPLKAESDALEKKIRELSVKKKSNPKLEPYYNLEIIAYLFKTIDIYIRMSNLSLNVLGIKNNKSLDLAKSNFSRILQLMKEIVGDDVDRESLKDNEEYLEKINRLTPKHLYDLAIKIDDTLNNLRNSMGEESKWKWFFVELQAKVAVIVRNLINFSDILKYRDPREQFFRTRIEHLRLAKDLLEEAAKQYRTKYELSSKSREDLKKSIELLEALRKIHITMAESNDAEKLKTIIDAARLNLEAGDKKQDIEEKVKKKPK